MHPPLQHLAVPVAEKHAGAPLGRQASPVAPERRTRQLLVGLLVEGLDLDQPRVHPLVEQLDRLALAGALDAVEQHDQRKARLLAQLELRLEQRLAQFGHRGVVGFLVDLVADFGGFEHAGSPWRYCAD
ncbi:hypothetical protein D3C75_906410 [compost metagenome]